MGWVTRRLLNPSFLFMASKWCDCELVAYSLKAQDRSRCTRLGWHSFGKPDFGPCLDFQDSPRYFPEILIQHDMIQNNYKSHRSGRNLKYISWLYSRHRGLDEVRKKNNVPGKHFKRSQKNTRSLGMQLDFCFKHEQTKSWGVMYQWMSSV